MVITDRAAAGAIWPLILSWEEAQKRLSLAEENLLRLKDILTELEDRIGPLKVQSEKAKKYLSYSEQKKQIQVSLWVCTLNESRKVIQSYEEKVLICRNQHEDIEKQLQQIEEAVQQVYRTIRDISVQMEQKRAYPVSYTHLRFSGMPQYQKNC